MREDGYIVIVGEYGNVRQEASTLQCAHCGGHFVVVKGSGTVRGFCTLCNQVTCGARKCMHHFPFEKKLDLIEAGKMPLIEL